MHIPGTSRPDAAGPAAVAILLAELMRRYGVMGSSVVNGVRAALKVRPLPGAGEPKARVFDERAIGMALDRLEAAHA